MSTLIKILLSIVIALFFTSCQFDLNLGDGKKGDGNVVTNQREVNEEFTVVKASEGLDVYIIQDDKTEITVEADENIINLIRTDIVNNTLNIHLKERVGWAKSKKITVSLPNITRLETSSGADIETINTIKTDRLELHSSSGSDLVVSVDADEVDSHTSSGANIRISGTAGIIYADASSGSDIKAGELTTKKAVAKASSGAEVTVHATEEVEANSSSGGDVNYSGTASVIKNNRN